MLQGSSHYYPERALQIKGVHVRGVQGCTHDQPDDWAYELWLNLHYSTPLIHVVIGLGKWLRQLVRLAGKILV